MDAAFWNNRYAVTGHVYGEAPNAFVAEVAAGKFPPGRCWCLAEGEGRNAVHSRHARPSRHRRDQSEVGLAKARRLAGARGVEIETMLADLANYSNRRRRVGGKSSRRLRICHQPCGDGSTAM